MNVLLVVSLLFISFCALAGLRGGPEAPPRGCPLCEGDGHPHDVP